MKVTLGNPFPGVPPFRPGDEVKVVAGPFADYRGHVESVDAMRGRLTVIVNVFGRETSVDLGFQEVRKA